MLNILKYEEYSKYIFFVERQKSVFSQQISLLENQSNDNDNLIRETEDDVQRCVAIIVGLYKFFAEFVYSMRFIYTYRVNTMATDGKNIYVNPRFAKTLTDKQMVFVICHEILHVLLKHFTRATAHNLLLSNETQREKWNYATDYELNPLLVDEGLLTADEVKKMGALYDEKWFEKTAEYIYDHLGDINPPQPPGSDEDFPAPVGSCVKLKDGSYGVITSITASGEYEIEPITREEVYKKLGR
jgi:hypothetical protein